jgi:serine-type D-Ala-D-Ala carboxypeptidase (penicillin-binding protein 5/6)
VHVKKVALLLVLVIIMMPICTAIADEVNVPPAIDDVIKSLSARGDACIILFDAESGEVLFEQNADTRSKTASTAKLLTCIVALENSDMDEIVTISSRSASRVGSSLQLIRGEQLKMKDLLNGMMMVSGNDAANAVAEHISGSQREFAKLMNETAQRIGMSSSNFTNPIGISDRTNYSTARDMLTLALYAMSNEQLTAITNQSKYDMPATNKNVKRTVHNTNLLFDEESPFFYEYITGLKTGSSSRAKGSLVATARKDGIDLVCVVMNDRSSRYSARWQIVKSLFEYGFSRYTTLNARELVLDLPQVEINVANAQSTVLCEYPSIEEHNIVVTNAAANDILCGEIEARCEIYDNITAPIFKGDVIGSVTYINRNTGVVFFEGVLIAAQDVAKPALAAALPETTPHSPQEAPLALQIAMVDNDSTTHASLLFASIWVIITLLAFVTIHWLLFKNTDAQM